MTVAFRANLNGSNQSISAGSPQKINFSNTDYNVGSGFSTANSRFVAPSAGIYCFTAAAIVGANGSGANVGIEFYKNGSTTTSLVFICPGAAINGGALVTDVLQLAAEDYIEVRVTQSNGANRNVSGDTSWTWFAGFLVGNV